MKATSKLISVVLILALCLSLFTVSAFAAGSVVVQGETVDRSKVSVGGYRGSGAGSASAPAETAQDDASDDDTQTVVSEGFVEVATVAELQSALASEASQIQLTAQVDWVGALELDYDVVIDLGGKGKGLAFSGSGDAAIVSSARAELFNGNIFVSGASVGEDGESVPGFRTVATSAENGSVYLHGVYVKYSEAGENSIFGTGISLGNGTFSQDVSAYYGEGELESGYVVNDQTADGGMFDVTAKPAAVEDNGDDAVEAGDADIEKKDDEVASLTGVYGEGADRIVVTVSAKNLPKDLKVEVFPMDNSELQVGEDEEVLFVVDITLYKIDENGEYVLDENGDKQVYEPVDDPNVSEVNVTIRHPALGNVEEGEEVTLYHIVKGEAVPVTEPEEIAGQTSMDFTTDSFSPYGAAKNNTTGYTGDVHYRVVELDAKEISYYGDNLTIAYTGNMPPEAVSIMPYELATSGDYETYKAYLLDYDAETPANSDYTVNKDSEDKPDGTITIKKEALVSISDGKYGIVFWYWDENTRVYMVQPVIIVTTEGVEGVGEDFTPDTFGDNSKGTFDAEMCDYDAVRVKLTNDLQRFTITGGDCGDVTYDIDVNKKKITIGGKQYNASEYFTVEEYTATDPLGHEFVAGKVLTLSQALLKKLGFHDDNSIEMYVRQKETEAAGGPFKINITPGIRVADGLDDYIKGKNLWVKFEACAPIDYDSDGTLAIWIGGQKISHDYYSISNDHKTLWIYRNLLDQLKSNNSYTLKARLWSIKDWSTKEKVTWYPATASFNVLAAGSTSSKSPKTGDESNVALWASVLVLSGGAVIALIPKKRKNK